MNITVLIKLFILCFQWGNGDSVKPKCLTAVWPLGPTNEEREKKLFLKRHHTLFGVL